MQFSITDPEDLETLAKWQEEQIAKIEAQQAGTQSATLVKKIGGRIYTGMIGGLFSYIFTPTNVGTVVRVENGLNNEHIELYGGM